MDVVRRRLQLLSSVPLFLLARQYDCYGSVVRDATRGMFVDPDLSRTRWRTLEIVLLGLAKPQVRSVVFWRLSAESASWTLLCLAALVRHFMAGLDDLEIRCETIGPGFVISHGYGSVLWAQSIGRDCTVSHGVTLGGKDERSPGPWRATFPVVGNDVTIFPGAIVIGGISVGDGAQIGAGSVVLRDVAARSIVAGNPASVISTDVPVRHAYNVEL